MRKLRQVDIESMERELEVLKKEELSSIVGGVIYYDAASEDQFISIRTGDCALRVLDYLSDASYKDIRNTYFDDRANNGFTEKEVKDEMRRIGISSEYVENYYGKYVSDTGMASTHKANREYSLEMEFAISSAIANSAKGIYGSMTIDEPVSLPYGQTANVGSGINHAVAITSYDSNTQTFSFWDPQQGFSGTCGWEDMNLFIAESAAPSGEW